MNKIILAHPLQQHSYKTAEGLDKAELLKKYITTVYYKKDKKVYKILEKVLGKNNIKRMKGRVNKIIEKYLITFNEFLGLLYLLVIRVDKYKLIEPKLYSILTNRFGKNIYKYMKKNKEEIIIMYDTTAYKCFSLLTKHNIKSTKILDMSSVAAPYIRKILLQELRKKEMKYKKSIKQKMKSYTKRKCLKYQKELCETDYFLVASKFAERSLTECGIDKSKFIYIPLRS